MILQCHHQEHVFEHPLHEDLESLGFHSLSMLSEIVEGEKKGRHEDVVFFYIIEEES